MKRKCQLCTQGYAQKKWPEKLEKKEAKKLM